MGIVWCLLYALTPIIAAAIIGLAGKSVGMDRYLWLFDTVCILPALKSYNIYSNKPQMVSKSVFMRKSF